jgi:hypothetical protein
MIGLTPDERRDKKLKVVVAVVLLNAILVNHILSDLTPRLKFALRPIHMQWG